MTNMLPSDEIIDNEKSDANACELSDGSDIKDTADQLLWADERYVNVSAQRAWSNDVETTLYQSTSFDHDVPTGRPRPRIAPQPTSFPGRLTFTVNKKARSPGSEVGTTTII